MADWPTTRGVMALGDDRDAMLAAGRELASARVADSVVVHLAQQGQDRKFVAALRAATHGPVEPLAERLAGVATRGAWAAEFRQVKSHGHTAAQGEPTPGVGAVFGIWRHPRLTHAEFDAYWRDVHAPLALEHHRAMWDYVQCSFQRPLVAHATDYDGVAICQFPTLEDLRLRFYAGPESQRAIAEDVVLFGDPTRGDRVRMTEFLLV